MARRDPRFSEVQQQQRESTARCALEQLVELLTDAARDICINPKLGGRNRALALGRGATLFATIDRVSKALSTHPDAGVRADLLTDLHDAIEAAVILADGVKAPVAHRLRTANALGKRLANAKTSKVEAIIYEELEKIWKPNDERGPYEVAGVIHHDVCQRLIRELCRKEDPPIKAHTIAKSYLRKHPYFSKSD